MILNDGSVSDVHSICESFVEFFKSVFVDNGSGTNDIIVGSISTEFSQIGPTLFTEHHILTPIHKFESRQCIENCRGLAILPTIGKCCEL